MTSRQSQSKASRGNTGTATKRWASLTWEDLDRWAGGRSVSRGRTYQRGGRVKDLAVSDDGRLLATVVGGDRYVASVWWNLEKKKSGIESRCTCPVGYSGCKHAVAVVADYLQSLAAEKEVPVADPEDPRWAQLAGSDADVEEDIDEFEDEFDDDQDDFKHEDDELPARKPPKPTRKRTTPARTNWNDKIERHIRDKSREELADLVWSLTQRFPELYQEFRERIALSEGNVERLLAESRRELRSLTSEISWRNDWTGEGYTPDYSQLKHRFERLVELGHWEAVVDLGREFIRRGMEQVGQSQDEGDTAMAVADCLPIVFEAVIRSSLTGPQKLLFAIDAHLVDDYDVIGDTSDPIFSADWTPADWSAVADSLALRLQQRSKMRGGDLRDYHRDCISNWLLQALEKGGRHDELLAVYETEARATGSYERLVKFLIAERRFEDAERWAREGIEKTSEKLPGIASALAASLCEMARQRRQWNVVAAHAACQFFDRPSVATFEELVKESRKAKCQDQVRATALRFLETGTMPFRLATSRKGERQLNVEDTWPLPVPHYLLPLLRLDNPRFQSPGPHFDVLLDMAIAAKRPDDVLHWYDKMRPGEKRSTFGGGRYGIYAYADRVAEAVAATHPERAIEIYLAALNAQLPHAHHSAYESAAAYLRKLRPIFQSLGRTAEWTQLLSDIRLNYRNRPRFMEILDKLDGVTILQSEKSRKRR